jgi:uncharacterized protein (DUF58 family)
VSRSILSRYLNPDLLAELAHVPIEPQGLVIGNLAGAHKSPLNGFAVEFASHREYVLGDDPRHVDWRQYYKRDRLFTKQYELETNLVCHLVLDISRSMRYGEGDSQKLQYSAQLAVTLAYAIIRQNDKVSLSTVDDKVRGTIPPGTTMAQLIRMTQHLDGVDPAPDTNLGACLTELAGRYGRREIVMIFSDAFGDLEQLEAAIQRLRYARHEVVLFHVLHRDEVDFEFDGMIKFNGLEMPEEHLAQANDIRAGYLAALKTFMTDLQAVCQRNRVERVDVVTDETAGRLLADYLSERTRRTIAGR